MTAQRPLVCKGTVLRINEKLTCAVTAIRRSGVEVQLPDGTLFVVSFKHVEQALN